MGKSAQLASRQCVRPNPLHCSSSSRATRGSGSAARSDRPGETAQALLVSRLSDVARKEPPGRSSHDARRIVASMVKVDKC